MTEEWEASVPTARRAPQHIRLFSPDDAYEHLCILTLLPSLGPHHLMLADALSPHGSNATLASVGTLSEGFERFVTSPLYLVGYVRWDARSDQSSFVKRSLQQLSGRNPTTRLGDNFRKANPQIGCCSGLLTTWGYLNSYPGISRNRPVSVWALVASLPPAVQASNRSLEHC
jgi:hypothetical protein